MIIILDESIVTSLQPDSPQRLPAIAAIQICTQQVKEGNHILFAKHTVFDTIFDVCPQLDQQTSAILRRSRDKMTQRKQIFEFATIFIKIVHDDGEGTPTQEHVGAKKYISLPVSTIANCSSLLAKPLLMTENISDAKLYLKLAANIAGSPLFKELNWLGSIPMKSELAPGGGLTIAQLYKHHKDITERIGLAIADADIKYPFGSAGDTASALVNAHNSAPACQLLDIHIIETRTVENLIPRAEIIRLAEAIDPVQGYRANRIVAAFGASPFWAVYPIKNGIKCFQLDGTTAESKFWTALLGSRTCVSSSSCKSKKDCSTSVSPSVSSSLLANAVSNGSAMRITKHCTTGIEATWIRLLTILYSWFCGTEKVAHI